MIRHVSDHDQALQRLQAIADARADEPAAVVDALDAGVMQKDVATVLGHTREWVRQTAATERARRGGQA